MTPAELETLLSNIGVEATDDLTVVITLKQPQATFATQMALWFSWPIPTHVIESPGAEWPANPTQMVYSGPFTVESYQENDHIVLSRNDNYGGGDLANRLPFGAQGDQEARRGRRAQGAGQKRLHHPLDLVRVQLFTA